jgi:probable phosphoglycerate mutase
MLPLPQVFLARHGETAWTVTGQHTGRTDLPLTERGQRNAQRLGERLAGSHFSKVLVSPLLRTRQTCELAGFASIAEVDPDLVEWNYGDFEGRTTAEIRKQEPDWQLFLDGCPGGESVAAVSARADRVVAALRQMDGEVLVFSSGHFSRVLAARWLGVEASAGRYLYLGTATLSCLGYEHTTAEPVLRLWNDARHVGD